MQNTTCNERASKFTTTVDLKKFYTYMVLKVDKFATDDVASFAILRLLHVIVDIGRRREIDANERLPEKHAPQIRAKHVDRGATDPIDERIALLLTLDVVHQCRANAVRLTALCNHLVAQPHAFRLVLKVGIDTKTENEVSIPRAQTSETCKKQSSTDI